jgi:large subunit ribosomal protein L11
MEALSRTVPPSSVFGTCDEGEGQMAKKVMAAKLQVKAGQANPSRRSVRAGSAGSTSWNSARPSTRRRRRWTGSPVPVIITYYADKSFSFEMKTAPASFYLKKARPEAGGQAQPSEGSIKPGREVAGTVTVAQVRRSPKPDEGPERERYRSRDEDHPRLRPVDGHRGEGLIMAKLAKRSKAANAGSKASRT